MAQPAAGTGKRMMPLTLEVPKELIPFNRKPMIQLAVEEALLSGIQRIIVGVIAYFLPRYTNPES